MLNIEMDGEIDSDGKLWQASLTVFVNGKTLNASNSGFIYDSIEKAEMALTIAERMMKTQLEQCGEIVEKDSDPLGLLQ